MILYDMLNCTYYYQKVWIYVTNVYDQNMLVFKGTVQEARGDADSTWDFLTCEVDHYSLEECGILLITVKNKYYEERLETQYTQSDRWGKKKEERPYLYWNEIKQELREAAIDSGD